MKGAAMLVIGVLGLGLVAFAAPKKAAAKKPATPLDVWGPPVSRDYYERTNKRLGHVKAMHFFQPLKAGDVPEDMKAESHQIMNALAARQAALRDYAKARGLPEPHPTGMNVDQYTKQSFPIFRALNKTTMPERGSTLASGPTEWGWGMTDEYGRVLEGWGYGMNPLKTMAGIAQQALPLVPGIGPPAAAALATTIALGQGKSLEDAALAGARAALPPYAQIAFDIGVGTVLEGKPADQAAIDALDKQYPGARAAYDKGRAMAKQAGAG